MNIIRPVGPMLVIDDANSVTKRACVHCGEMFCTMLPQSEDVCGACRGRLPPSQRENFLKAVSQVRKKDDPNAMIDLEEVLDLLKPDELDKLERRGALMPGRKRWQ